ncbi:hypothetical protein [Streptomyces sp. NPDC001404]|uniref:hypothetical protein n=1 Tax=Streptomyces sp. NPDC001404 TaxID=3364571 RepID=UPI0036B2B2D6
MVLVDSEAARDQVLRLAERVGRACGQATSVTISFKPGRAPLICCRGASEAWVEELVALAEGEGFSVRETELWDVDENEMAVPCGWVLIVDRVPIR